jgi:hypothetical protein
MDIQAEDAETGATWDALIKQGQQLEDDNSKSGYQAAEQAPPEPEINSGELVGDALYTLAGIFAPNWEIQPEESAQLGTVYGKLLDKYMPDLDVGKYGAEIGAIVVTGMILRTRIGVPLRLPEKPEKTADKGEESPSPAPPPPQPVVNGNNNGVLTAKAVKS